MAVHGAVGDYLQKEFGGVFGLTSLPLVIGVAPVQVLPFNFDRVNVTFVNLGASVITLCPDPQVSGIRGIRLAALGGAITLNVRDDGVLCSWEWWAISDVAAGNLFVLPVQREAQ